MIRVKTAKRRRHFWRGGYRFTQEWRLLSEPGDALPEGVKPDLTAEQAEQIRAETRYLEVEDVEPADPSAQGSSGQGDDPAAKAAGESSLGRININAASPADLGRVKGIGEELAEAIVAYREEHGDYESVADLEAIAGIGPATAKKLASVLTV